MCTHWDQALVPIMHIWSSQDCVFLEIDSPHTHTRTFIYLIMKTGKPFYRDFRGGLNPEKKKKRKKQSFKLNLVNV